MSVLPLAETLKNTIEVLNEIYEQNSGSGLQWVLFLKLSWNIILDWIIYIFTFQWVNDFIQLPIFSPQGSESIFSDLLNHLVGEAPNPYSLNFPVLTDRGEAANFGHREAIQNFVSGFCNCFFLYVPLSPVQWIWLRRIIIDSPWAGRVSTMGLIFGHLSLLGCCLFGFRDIINAWFGLEPLSYFLGIWLIFIVIFEMAHKPLILKKSQTKERLFKIFLISFGCVWTDQSGFYQYFGHLTLHNGVSLMDFSSFVRGADPVPQWENPKLSLYYLGIIVGSFFWTYIISQGVLRLGYLFLRLTRYKYPYSYWIRGFHNFCLIGCITLTLTSFPYYGPDYLFTNPLGFFPQDSVFETTSLLKTDKKDIQKGRLGEKSSFASVDTDLSLFDRGRYAGGPVVEFHFESLNYQQEYAWRSRFDRRGLTRGGGLLDQYLTTQFGPVEEALKKQRREKKRAQQIQKWTNIQEKSLQTMGRTQDGMPPIMSNESFNDLSLSHSDLLPEGGDPNYLIDNYEYLIERFVENYTAEANSEDPEVPDLVDEKMIDFSAFSEIAKYGFDLFSMFEAVELNPVDEEFARDIKEKFSDNLVYKFLVHMDISHFLQRLPKEHQLTSQDEISLFEKRLALAEYYDTMRSYSQLPLSRIFQPLFCGPKSYVHRIYNQQFKGTLKIVERLFSIHLENEENIPNLNNEENQKSEVIYFKLKKEPSVLKFDQPLYKSHFLDKNPLIHEQLLEQMPSSIQTADSTPFLKETKPLPFFVGWNNEKRKFIVTNRLLTRQKTLSETRLRKEAQFRQYPYIAFGAGSAPLPRNKTAKAGSLPSESRTVPPSAQKDQGPVGEAAPGRTTGAWDPEEVGPRSGQSPRRKDLSGDLRFKKPGRKLPSNLSESPKSPQAVSAERTQVNHSRGNIQSFKFTTWPVTEKALQRNPIWSRLFRTYDEMKSSADDLYKYAEPLMEEESLIYDKLPSIVQRIEVKNKLQMSLAPRRGGFLWPGNEPFSLRLPTFTQYFQKLQKWGFFK